MWERIIEGAHGAVQELVEFWEPLVIGVSVGYLVAQVVRMWL